MKFGKLVFIAIMLLTMSISITIYKQRQPELKFVGIDFWNHEPNTLHVMVDIKTNEVYLQNPDGTNTHKWIRKDTGKIVLLGEELPIEGN